MLIDMMLFAILAVCVVTDLRERKIYNKVVFPGLALAFTLRLLLDGLPGAASSAAGFLTGLGLLLIPYLLGGMGAGDVKLLALVGACKGTMFVLTACLYMAFIGGAVGLYFLFLGRGAGRRIHWALISLFLRRYGVKLHILDRSSMAAAYPYGPAIAGGAVLSLFYGGGWLFA